MKRSPSDSGAAGRVLLIAADGSAAHVYNFDGAVFTPFQTVTPEAGLSISGAMSLPDGTFKLYSGAPGTGRSTMTADYSFDGAQFVKGTTTALPAVDAQSVHANVFLFDAEPFVSPAPALVRTLGSPDWTSVITLAGGTPRRSVRSRKNREPAPRDWTIRPPSPLGRHH